MRLLAPFTVYNGKAYKLHLFETENGIVSHKPVEEETAYTLYVQGIAIIAGDALDTDSLNCIVRQKQADGASLLEISEAIAVEVTTAGSTIYVANFPFEAIQKI